MSEKKEITITSADVFDLMCRTTVCVANHYTELIPSTVMAQHFNVSKTTIRKLLQELIDEGLVQSGCESCYSDYKERYYIVRGFCVTDKGRRTEVYKRAEEEEYSYINKMLEGFEG